MAKRLPIKKLRTAEQVSRLRKFSWKLNFSYKKIVLLFIAILFVIFFTLLCYVLFASSYFQIQQVRFDEQNIMQLQNPEIYAALHDSMMYKNYIRIMLFGYDFSRIQNLYPFIKDISFSRQGNNSIFVSCEFQEPRVVFTLGKNVFIASYYEHFYPLFSGDSFLSGKQFLQLPDYISDIDIIKGIYSRFSEAKLIESLTTIQETIASGDIQYITFVPGNALILLGMRSGQELLLFLQKDINKQLVKWLDLQQYYKEFINFRFLDLGSTEHIIAR